MQTMFQILTDGRTHAAAVSLSNPELYCYILDLGVAHPRSLPTANMTFMIEACNFTSGTTYE